MVINNNKYSFFEKFKKQKSIFLEGSMVKWDLQLSSVLENTYSVFAVCQFGSRLRALLGRKSLCSLDPVCEPGSTDHEQDSHTLTKVTLRKVIGMLALKLIR